MGAHLEIAAPDEEESVAIEENHFRADHTLATKSSVTQHLRKLLPMGQVQYVGLGFSQRSELLVASFGTKAAGLQVFST